jgi:hypothetical protein
MNWILNARILKQFALAGLDSEVYVIRRFMKYVLVLLAAGVLAACGSSPANTAPPHGIQLTVRDFSANIDKASGTVDLRLTVQNHYPVALQGLNIHLVPRDGDGQPVPGANLELEAARPIAPNEIIGPIRVTAQTNGHEVSCIELYQIEATLPNYSITFASGTDAFELVQGKRSTLCPPVAAG